MHVFLFLNKKKRIIFYTIKIIKKTIIGMQCIVFLKTYAIHYLSKFLFCALYSLINLEKIITFKVIKIKKRALKLFNMLS